eukprot:228941-Pyramimonas_sp.AAC.1
MPGSTYQKWCFESISDYESATVTLVRGVEVPEKTFWRNLGSLRRNCQVDPRRRNAENNVLA